MSDNIEALRAENERLRKERDEWKQAAHDVDHSGGLVLWSDKWSEMLQEYKWAYEDQKKAEAKLEEAAKVLEPIVAVIEASEVHARLNGNDPDRVPDTHEVTPYKDVPNVTLGHLRALKSFLANLKGAE